MSKMMKKLMEEGCQNWMLSSMVKDYLQSQSLVLVPRHNMQVFVHFFLFLLLLQWNFKIFLGLVAVENRRQEVQNKSEGTKDKSY